MGGDSDIIIIIIVIIIMIAHVIGHIMDNDIAYKVEGNYSYAYIAIVNGIRNIHFKFFSLLLSTNTCFISMKGEAFYN